MTYNEHKAAMARAMSEMIDAVKEEERAKRRREQAIDNYETVLGRLLAEVKA